MLRLWNRNWPSRTWRWALFTVAMVNLAITGILYHVDLKRRVIGPYPYSSVSMATKMIPNHKIPVELKYTIGSHFAEHGNRKGSNSVKTNNTKGSYNYSFDGINITSSIKGVNLLIFSYMRGGSSMNGKVFAEMDENFFVHEPLIQLAPHHYLTGNKLCEVQTKQCKSEMEAFRDTPVAELRKAAIRTLKQIYSCDILNLDDRILRTIMFDWVRGMSKSGTSWNNFTACYIKQVQPNVTDFVDYVHTAWTKDFAKHKDVLRLLGHPGPMAETFRVCLDKLLSHCRKSELRVAKVLRISMSFLPVLMSEIPDLKVLFVIRDPRGTLYSRIRTDWYQLTTNDSKAVKDNIESLCFKIHEDINSIDKMKKEFPGRILEYSLEEIMKEPVKRFQTILRFSGLETTDAYVNKIKEVFEEKPTFLDKWKYLLDPKYVNWTQRYCSQGFERYGFEKIYV